MVFDGAGVCVWRALLRLHSFAASTTLGRPIRVREGRAAGTQIFSVEGGVGIGSIWKFRQAERLTRHPPRPAGRSLSDLSHSVRLPYKLRHRLAACITLRGFQLTVFFQQFVGELEIPVVGFGEGLFEMFDGLKGVIQRHGLFREEFEIAPGKVFGVGAGIGR